MTHVESSFAAMAHLINKYCEVPGQDITTLFKSFDTDGSGAVSYQELRDGEWPRLGQYAESQINNAESYG